MCILQVLLQLLFFLYFLLLLFFFYFGEVSSWVIGVEDRKPALRICIVIWGVNQLSHKSWTVVSCPAIFWQARVPDSGFSVWVKKIQFESASAAAGDAFNNIHVFAEGTHAWGKISLCFVLLLLFAQVNSFIFGRS